jgi:hypothetical protein
MPQNQTLGEIPAPPPRQAGDDLNLDSGIVKKPSSQTSTTADSLNLSSGLVPRKEKPGKPQSGLSRAWEWLWKGTLSPENAQKVVQLGINLPKPEEYAQAAAKAREQGHPAAAALSDLEGYTASGYKAAGDFVSSMTSPGQVALTALTAGGSELEQAGYKVLAKLATVPGKAAGLTFAAQGLKIAATPQQPGESRYDAFWRRNLGLLAFLGTAHESVVSAKGTFQWWLKRQFHLDDDLAGKVSSQVSQIDQTRKQTAGAVTQIDEATGKQIRDLQESLQKDLQDIQKSSSTRVSGIRAQAENAIEQGKGKITDLQAQRLRTGANTVADTMQAFLIEKDRATKPFDDIAAKIKGSVAEPDDVRALIDKAFLDTGLKPEQIPPRALELLKNKRDNVVSGNVRMRTPDGHYLEVDADKVHWFTEKGYDVVEKTDDSGSIKFDTLTRVREDIGQAANAAKDTAVKRALFKSADAVTDFQEGIARKHKLGPDYAKAKQGYMRFIRGIGSDMVHTFLDASDAESQALAPKIAELTTKQNAEALRTVLKAAGVDVKPLDEVIAQIDLVDKGIDESKRVAGTMVSQQERSAEQASTGTRADVRSDIRSTKERGLQQASEAQKQGEQQVSKIKEQEVVPEQDVESLKGKSNRELLEARLRHQMSNGHTTGFVNTWAISSIIYGLVKTAQGSTFGPPLVGIGIMRTELPRLIKEPRFQDWVVRQSGLEPGSPQATRLRKGLSALSPVLQKMLKSGVPQAAAVKAAQSLGEPPSR